MKTHTIIKNAYLKKNVNAFYHCDYVGYEKPGNPDYVVHLKNTLDDAPVTKLERATSKLAKVFEEDWPQILDAMSVRSFTVCAMPRSKSNFSENQQLFRKTVQMVSKKLTGFEDGTEWFVRTQNTRTTHLRWGPKEFVNDGPKPYCGITKKTCLISSQIVGKDILLVDDVYTKTVDVNEDAIQALFDKGARSVVFYSIGRTVKRGA